MKDEIQVAVVGAGPAGCTAAEVAALRGAEVALIERKREIGSPVQCGGFLPEVHELQALMPRARLPQTLQNIPGRCILHRTHLQRIYSPSGGSKEFPVAGRVVDRRAFDRFLAHRAARAGARVLPATRASWTDGALQLSGHFSGALRPQIVIGADGPLSSISRAMGNLGGEMGICLEYEMADIEIDPDAAEMYFSADYAPGGYAWIIPLGDDLANVGVGVRASYLASQKLPRLLDRFVREHPVAGKMLRGGEVMAVMRGLVPASGSARSVQKDNLLLAGDAAGHVMATRRRRHTPGHGRRKDRGRGCSRISERRCGTAGVPALHSRRIWKRAGEIGSDQEDGGYGHEERSAHECSSCSSEPRSDEIRDAGPDPAALGLARAPKDDCPR